MMGGSTVIVCFTRMLMLWTFASQCGAAVEPLARVGIGVDPTLSAEVASLKTTLASVQGSLITSVGLIQDQLDQFGKQYLSALESRLDSMDLKLIGLGENVQRLHERAGGWDTLQHHVSSWGDQMTSLDTKVDHLARSQVDQLTTLTGQVSNVRVDLGRGLENMAEQTVSMESRILRSSGDVTENLRKLEIKLDDVSKSTKSRSRTATTTGHHTSSSSHRGPLCSDIRASVRSTAEKVGLMYDIVSTTPDDYSNNNNNNNNNVVESDDEEINWAGLEADTEKHLVKLFRRVAQPFKKANKRLREMETVGRQFESALDEISTNVQVASADVDRKFNDFFNMTLEMFEHQHHQLEASELNLAGLRQCCTGTASDLSSFRAKTESVLDRLDTHLAHTEADRQTSRSREQLRFDSDRILSAIKEQEKLLIDGFDSIIVGTNVSTTSTTSTTTVAPTTTATTPKSTTVVQPQPTKESSRQFLKTCQDFMNHGFLESKVYTVDSEEADLVNAANRDFRQRFCDQQVNGGGWTVIQRRGDFGEPRTNFTKQWKEYKDGFGDLYGEFWFGNDFLHRITNGEQPVMLRIELEDFDRVTAFAEYTTFRVEDESENYRVWVGGYSGNATDSFSAHNGYEFSTVDRNHDDAPKCCPCATAYGGGWWFYSCFESNLNGEYHLDPYDNNYYRGIIWELWRGDYSLKSARMMIRSKAFHNVVTLRSEP